MKAIEEFKIEAMKQFGAGAVFSEESALLVCKKVGRTLGLGHLRQAGMLTKSGLYQIPVSMESVKVKKPKLKRFLNQFQHQLLLLQNQLPKRQL